ncbi:NAD(P)-dependent dehydrogenase, short-chain alcohol dehydrogenase family [Faunimonas pinastri]|uniref:NAD(P)-dependent dehydrogenase, short-chain alcohol dehydrogenase family n=1 Tax=Faunimonas pinastri TaxID=1855383 RepID=A0A1H9E0G4_9HYPH|nr:SDR family oxidoreductase [Faunimonas pinastri]SEQ19057.1 NAD(P)-dependent dehydrogenase, short-chain alcohol dehydrogenase family [Faunimonas pinastri]
MRVAGKIAVVTGAYRGIGRACAEALAGEGAQVIALDLMAEAPDYAESSIIYRQLDVGSETDWQLLAEEVSARFGRVDILVCAAGIAPTKSGAHDVTMADWEHILRVNQTGVMLGMRMATGMMLGKGPLSIVNISSIWGQVGGTGQIAYHASKGAVINMTRNVAITYARQGIRANAVLPGLIDTEMVRIQKPEMNAATLALTPMGRIGLPEEIAAGVLFLASDEASFVTGAVLSIDGGFTAQ